MSDRIHVAIRIRPISNGEQSNEQRVWAYDENSISQLAVNSEGKHQAVATYTFDRVYGEHVKTNDIYYGTARSIIKSALDGINATVFAYGQTSSGKTHTMRGDESSPGIIPLAVSEVFDYFENNERLEFQVRVSYMEIYNEVIRDLLQPNNVNLKIHEDVEKGVFVGNLREEVVTKSFHALELLNRGDVNRKIGCTNMNEYSSRSHCIFRMIIESRPRDFGQNDVDLSNTPSARNCFGNCSPSQPQGIKVSFLNLVDLAGSERANSTGAEGIRLKEGAHINKSLLTLERVISKLSSPNMLKTSQSHIPFRDSRLTRILQSSLGGNARTLIICTITPASIYQEESHSTLKFANAAKNIQNKPLINQFYDDKTLLKQYRSKISILEQQIEDMKKLNINTSSGPHSSTLNETDLSYNDNIKLFSKSKKIKRRRSWEISASTRRGISHHPQNSEGLTDDSVLDNENENIWNGKLANCNLQFLKDLMKEKSALKSENRKLCDEVERLKSELIFSITTPQKNVSKDLTTFRGVENIGDDIHTEGFEMGGNGDSDLSLAEKEKLKEEIQKIQAEYAQAIESVNLNKFQIERLTRENERLKISLEESEQIQQQLLEEHLMEEVDMQERIEQLECRLKEYENVISDKNYPEMRVDNDDELSRPVVSESNSDMVVEFDHMVSSEGKMIDDMILNNTRGEFEPLTRSSGEDSNIEEKMLEFLARKACFESEFELQKEKFELEREEFESRHLEMSLKVESERNELEAQRMELDLLKIELEENISKFLGLDDSHSMEALASILCTEVVGGQVVISDGESAQKSQFLECILNSIDKLVGDQKNHLLGRIFEVIKFVWNHVRHLDEYNGKLSNFDAQEEENVRLIGNGVGSLESEELQNVVVGNDEVSAMNIMKEKLIELEHLCANQKVRISEVEMSNDGYRKDICDRESNLLEKDRALEVMEAKMKRIEGELDSASKLNEGLNSDLYRVISENRDLNFQLCKYSDEIGVLRSDKILLEKSIESMQFRRKEIELEVINLVTRIEVLTETVGELEVKLEMRSKELEEREEVIRRVQANELELNQRLRDTRVQMESVCGNLMEAVEKYDGCISKLEKRVLDLSDRNEVLNRELEGYCERAVEWAMIVDGHECELRRVLECVDTVMEELRKNQDDLDGLREELGIALLSENPLSQGHDEIGRLQERIEEFSMEIANLKDGNVLLDEEKALLAEKCKKLQDQFLEAESFKEKYESCQCKIVELEGSLDEMERKLAQKTREYEENQILLDSTIERGDLALKELQSECIANRDLFEKYRVEYEGMKREYEFYLVEIGRLTESDMGDGAVDHLEAIRNDRNELNLELNTLRNESASQAYKISELQMEVSSAMEKLERVCEELENERRVNVELVQKNGVLHEELVETSLREELGKVSLDEALNEINAIGREIEGYELCKVELSDMRSELETKRRILEFVLRFLCWIERHMVLSSEWKAGLDRTSDEEKQRCCDKFGELDVENGLEALEGVDHYKAHLERLFDLIGWTGGVFGDKLNKLIVIDDKCSDRGGFDRTADELESEVKYNDLLKDYEDMKGVLENLKLELEDRDKLIDQQERYTREKIDGFYIEIEDLKREKEDLEMDLRAINEKNKSLEEYWNLDIAKYEKKLGEYKSKMEDLYARYQDKRLKLNQSESKFSDLKNKFYEYLKQERARQWTANRTDKILASSGNGDGDDSMKLYGKVIDADDKENQIFQ